MCCFSKYWSKRNANDEKTTKHRGKTDQLLNVDKRKNKCDLLDRNSEEEEEEGGNKEEFYARLDPDYLEYLKSKKQKALEAEQAMTAEQKQSRVEFVSRVSLELQTSRLLVHYALEEMKKSLSFISAKLVTKESRGNLNGSEINVLQERLASTEAQMCRILTALDAASDKVTRTSKKAKKMQQVWMELVLTVLYSFIHFSLTRRKKKMKRCNDQVRKKCSHHRKMTRMKVYRNRKNQRTVAIYQTQKKKKKMMMINRFQSTNQNLIKRTVCSFLFLTCLNICLVIVYLCQPR